MVGCPTCGAELTPIDEYDRLYCYDCRSYAPRTLHECPVCDRALVYLPQHQGHYCYGCEEYREVAGVDRPCPTCGEDMEYLSEYGRFYCNACEEYAPADYKPPQAGGAPVTPEGEENQGFAPFSREDMDLASKEDLMSWCREYGLDDTGMKYELRLRILEHVRKEGLLLKGERQVQLGADEVVEPEAKPPGPRAGPTEEPPAPETPPSALETQAPQVEVITEDSVGEGQRACLTCGGELTYIPQYARWYCYSCRSYAPIGMASRSSIRARPPGKRPAAATARAHKGEGQGSPGVGIGLAALGLLMFIAHMVLYQAPRIFDFPVFITRPDVEFALRFLSIVFIVLGLMAAVLVLRSQR